MVARLSRLPAISGLLLVPALLAIIFCVIVIQAFVESPEWGLLVPLLLVPLVESLILLIAFLSVDSDPCLAPKGELERLVAKKYSGLLLDRSPRMRSHARRVRRSESGSSTASGHSRAPTTESALDRLLLLKRGGAWL